jgi:hypothetical protein
MSVRMGAALDKGVHGEFQTLAFLGTSEARHDCARRGLAVNRRGRITTES